MEGEGARAEFESRDVQDLVSYLDSIASSVESEDLSEELYSKCLEELDGSEEAMARSAEGSRVLERLSDSSAFFASQLFARFMRTKKWRLLNILRDGCGSRVMESVLRSVCQTVPDSPTTLEDIGALCSLVAEHWEELCDQPYASHVIRCLAQLLAGEGAAGKRTHSTTDLQRKQVHPEFGSHLRLLLSRALDWNLMKDYLNDKAVSCLIQDFISLDSSCRVGALHQFVEACLDSADSEWVGRSWGGKQSSRVWEQVMRCADADQTERFYQHFLQQRLSAFAQHPFANFPLQRLLQSSSSTEMMADAYDELREELQQIILKKYHGVLCALVQGFAQSGDVDTFLKFEKRLMKHLDCSSPKTQRRLLLCCLLTTSSPTDVCAKDTESGVCFDTSRVHLQGSLLVQQWVKLGSKRLEKSWNALSSETLLALACHPAGAHAVEAALSADRLSVELRSHLQRSLLDNSWKLFGDKFGSRLFDHIWPELSLEQKCSVAATLVKRLKELRKGPIGMLMRNKYQLDTFQQSKDKWRRLMKSAGKKQLKTFKK